MPKIMIAALAGQKIDLLSSGVPIVGMPRIDISFGSLIFINSVNGSNQTQMYKQLANPLCTSWVAEFDFIIDGVGDGVDLKTVAHIPFALTANQKHPFRDYTKSLTDNDGIMVYLFNNQGSGSASMAFDVLLKDSSSFTRFCESPEVFLGIKYHFILERIDIDSGRLCIINVDSQTKIHSCSFPIPQGINDLQYIQHSNNPGATSTRILSARLDSTCIKDCYKIDSSSMSSSTINSRIRNQKIELFPNPSAGIINIELSSENGFEYLIFDQFGKIVKKGISQSPDLNLNLESLESGMYRISVKPEHGQELQRKISIIK
jgi:hypothetical protein